MARLTDIRTPEHYTRHPHQPKKRSFLKTFFRVITAPIWGPFYLVYLALKWIKNLITKIGRSVSSAIHRFDAMATSAIKNFFIAIPAVFKEVVLIIFKAIPKITRIFPTNWAAWLVFLLAATVIWQMAMTWDFPLLSVLNFNSDKWQAVFLSNNQVYFGHLRNSRGNTVILEDVFYLLNREGSSGADLVRLGNGNELHGPENVMFIPREQIIFWENLKSDSKVVQAIKQTDNR